jgi:Ca-activated chloride channel family protein
MVRFANPACLLLVLAVPPLLWWWLRRRRVALRYPGASLLHGLPSGRARLARWGGAALRGLALVCLAVALAGPRWPDLHTRIDTEGIAIVMLVDVSGSMAERDFDWQGQPISRLDALKKVFRLFVAGGSGPDATPDGADPAGFQGRPTDEIGLVTFATRPETPCPLTLSHSVLLHLLDAERPRAVPGESETNISDAIILGLHRLHAAGPRRKVLVLLSDGEHNVPRPRSGWQPLQAGQVAAGLGIPIYTIDAGSGPTSEALEGRPVSSGPEGETASPGQTRAQAVQTLNDLARMTHGQSFTAHDTAGLLAACRSIDALERTDIQSFQYRRYHEAYPWLALAAFALWCLALGLDLTLWRRLP